MDVTEYKIPLSQVIFLYASKIFIQQSTEIKHKKIINLILVNEFKNFYYTLLS